VEQPVADTALKPSHVGSAWPRLPNSEALLLKPCPAANRLGLQFVVWDQHAGQTTVEDAHATKLDHLSGSLGVGMCPWQQDEHCSFPGCPAADLQINMQAKTLLVLHLCPASVARRASACSCKGSSAPGEHYVESMCSCSPAPPLILMQVLNLRSSTLSTTVTGRADCK
jgi:hypothetical protein